VILGPFSTLQADRSLYTELTMTEMASIGWSEKVVEVREALEDIRFVRGNEGGEDR
jgi:hypothetical protein